MHEVRETAMDMDRTAVARMIDHTQLAATATRGDIERLCAEARQYGFASVCVNPVHVPLAARLLAGSDVAVCTVVGFPLGADSTEDKVAQAANALRHGAAEVDMVIDIGAAKEHRWDTVEQDIASVVRVAHGGETAGIVKVILETCYLTDDEIAQACRCALRAGADFVKTSTGFAAPKDADGNALPNGATVSAVSLMRTVVGADMGVKASGGIRTAQAARAMIAAGATRIGTSSGVAILTAWD